MNNLNNGRVVSINGSNVNESPANACGENQEAGKNVVNLSKKVDLNNVKIVKKDGTLEEYNVQKVVNAVKKSAARMLVELTDEDLQNICDHVDNSVFAQHQDYIDISKRENVREDIQTAYFGTNDETGWRSVASYYFEESHEAIWW